MQDKTDISFIADLKIKFSLQMKPLAVKKNEMNASHALHRNGWKFNLPRKTPMLLEEITQKSSFKASMHRTFERPRGSVTAEECHSCWAQEKVQLFRFNWSLLWWEIGYNFVGTFYEMVLNIGKKWKTYVYLITTKYIF